MYSHFDPNSDRLRRDIRRFAKQGRRLVDGVLTRLKEAGGNLSDTVSERGKRLSERLKRLEEESFTDRPDLLARLARQTWKVRAQMEEWMRENLRGPEVSGGAEQPADGDAAGEESDLTRLQPVPIGKHVLPPLPYPYNALEPHIDEKTMHLHHDEHHQSYVDGLNKAERMMAQARRTGDFDLIKHWEREAAFNGAGHYLHTLFWETMSPRGGGQPGGELARAIPRYFGSFDAFKKQFSAAAEKVEGGGWAILVWAPRAHHLEILQAEKHQNLSQWDVIPLLPLDVWEHAYYLKYPNKRKEYIKAWWNVVNWPEVERRFTAARQIAWKPY